MKAKLFFPLLVLLLAAFFLFPAAAAEYSGDAINEAAGGVEDPYPGYDIQYSLDTESGELRIYCGASGDREMQSFNSTDWLPWLADGLRDKIRTATIEEGVLSLARLTFRGCENLKTVYLPASITSIEDSVFHGCTSLETIYFEGNRQDFKKIEYDEVQNSPIAGTDARELIHYGESITVLLENQEGKVFDSYKIYSYFAGERYTVTPEAIDHMTYIGRKDEYKGKFREGDDREIVLTYECEHEYEIADLTKPCGSFCIYCTGDDPATEDEHLWEYTNEQKRSFLQPGIEEKYCLVCGTERYTEKYAYIWYVLVALGGILVLGGIALAIILPIRRRKKMKDLTW